jgi:hypothetical protein
MKLSVKEGSENYACTVIKLPAKQKVDGLDNLVRVTVFGNDCLIGKDSPEDELYLFFPAECALTQPFLWVNNLHRELTLNKDQNVKGFFEASGRVKALKFKGTISTGFVIPVTSLSTFKISGLKVGDEFTNIGDLSICYKYKVERRQSEKQSKESRFNKKLKRFDKLVPNQFRFHESTAHLAKNLHNFKEGSIIVITDKWHGTSAVFSNVLVNKELTLKERIAKWFGVPVVDRVYDNLYSSRSVLKNQYINKEQGGGFYGEDIWGQFNLVLKDKIEQGVTLYGEIVGCLPSGKMIQKNYDYGCNVGEAMFVCYRITYTKPDGNVIEYSWQQIKDYCAKYSIETVKELYFGVCGVNGSDQESADNFLNLLIEEHLEKKCSYCKNDAWAEGIVVRIDGKNTYHAYKLKSKNFLQAETKLLDNGEVDIESEESVSQEENN